ncbi:hypothetical protein SEVIR_9G077300v4 [Setaria viridis]|nr:hypothetical protein SEVIR_9G077300v2 [Setaria viridis]TKV91179.1 hypothetical protein SEVIR_9G077300v2 [Setaria viridis]
MGILEAVAWKSKNPSTIFSKKCLCTVGVEVLVLLSDTNGCFTSVSLLVKYLCPKIHIFMLEQVQRKGYAKDPSLVVHIILRSSPLMVSARVFMSKDPYFHARTGKLCKRPFC